MRKKQSQKLSEKFFVLAAVVTIAMVAALFIYVNASEKRITLQNQDYLKDKTSELAHNLDSAMSDGYNNVQILSALIGRSLNGPEVDIVSFQSLIKDSVFDFMEFADVDGMDHNITGGVSDARDRQYYLDAMKGNVGMELIYKSRATFETLFMYYSPVYYNSDIVGSIVGVYQASNRITNILTTKCFGETASSYLCTAEGRLVASNETLIPGEEKYIWDIPGVSRGQEAAIKSTLAGRASAEIKIDGNDTGAYLMPLEHTGWAVLQIFPETASESMMSASNAQVGNLLTAILFLYIVLMVLLVKFYRRKQAEVEAANAAKSTFLFNMSHDIRTPMNAIIGFTDRARKHMDDPEIVNDALNKVTDSSIYLLHLVNDILDMAKIESGKVEISEQLCSAVGAEEGLKAMYGGVAAEKDIKLHVERKDSPYDYIWADKNHVDQVMANLISNAIKYTNPGGDVWCTFTQSPCGREGYISNNFTVTDNGIGMSPDFLEKIFDEFERERTATQSGAKGTGLGMSIVKKLSDMLGGSLTISSEQGKGTSVSFNLPCRIPTEEEIESFKRAQHNPVAVDFEHLAGKRILLVEDNELNREIAVDMLEEVGFVVETAEDGDVAVEKVNASVQRGNSEYYDAVLMDIQMPRMNGYEATKAIRRLPDPQNTHLPIIALSANAFAEDIQKSIDAGMDDHLAKPIEIRALMEKLAKYI